MNTSRATDHVESELTSRETSSLERDSSTALTRADRKYLCRCTEVLTSLPWQHIRRHLPHFHPVPAAVALPVLYPDMYPD